MKTNRKIKRQPRLAGVENERRWRFTLRVNNTEASHMGMFGPMQTWKVVVVL